MSTDIEKLLKRQQDIINEAMKIIIQLEINNYDLKELVEKRLQ